MIGRIIKDNLYEKSLKIPNGVFRTRKSKKDRQHNGQKNIYYALRRKLKIE